MEAIDIRDWLKSATAQLINAGIPTAHLDSLILLEDLIQKDRSWILAHPEYRLDSSTIQTLDGQLEKRAKHIPLAYIRGKVEFYGRDFIVDSHTLVPRPETETMIDLLKRLDLPSGTSILDIGTGSGCIAVTAALELHNNQIGACDIDTDCLNVAKHNAYILGAKVTFFKSDLLDHAPCYNVLVANLPYVPIGFQINEAASHEPRHALFGGQDGLDLYRRLLEQVSALDVRPRYLLTESLPVQHKSLNALAKAAGFTLRKTDGFIQLFEQTSRMRVLHRV